MLCRVFIFMFLYVIVIKDCFKVTVEKLSTIYLPYQYLPTKEYGINKAAADAVAYDNEKQIIYSVGANNIHVVNMTDVTNLTVIHNTTIEDAEMTDVEFCGGLVFVSLQVVKADDVSSGFVYVYRRYSETSYTLEQVTKISVGLMPRMILPTHDCEKLVVATEPDYCARDIKRRLGAVSIITFQNLSTDNYKKKDLNFTHFNSEFAALETEGVRFVNHEVGVTFANDLEPEYITFSHNETMAYICLQENNAIATVDLVSERIINIYGLGFKNWKHFVMDPSDEDCGIHMQPWPVYGMYQPKAIKYVTIGGSDYIITANEGKEKCKEKTYVRKIKLSSIFDNNATRLVELQMSKYLGELDITKNEGFNVSTGSFDALYTFGGRSFSIWRADNMSLVYDSGSSISNHTAMLYPFLFNMEVEVEEFAFTSTDETSDNKGPEPKSLAIAKFENYTLIIVGNKQPGTLLLYSVDERKPVIEPKFETLFHDIQRLDAPWENLVLDHEAGMLDPEDIRYIPATDSPNGKPLLLVSGSVSGTLTLLQLNVEFEGSVITETEPSSTSTPLNTFSQADASFSSSLVINQEKTPRDIIDDYKIATYTQAGVIVLGIAAVLVYVYATKCHKK